jgi:trigger factor
MVCWYIVRNSLLDRKIRKINTLKPRQMNISKESIDALNAVITLTITKEDYEPKVNEVLKDYRKKVNMPGFRQGKVPAGLVKKMYGKAILLDEVNKLVSEKLSNFIVEEKLNLLGEPLPSENQDVIDFDTQEEFNFVFDIAEAPETEVKLSKRDKLPLYTISVTDEMLETQTKSITGRFGSQESVEVVSEKSLVKADFVQLDQEGNELEEGIKGEDTVLSLSVLKDEDTRKKLIGAKVGDSLVFDPKAAYPNDTEVSYILKIDKEAAEAVGGDFKFTIKDVSEFIDPEMNQDLFDKAFGEGVVNSEEEFVAKVKEDLVNQLSMEADYRFTTDAKEKLMKKVKIDLPEAFLKRWLLATNKDNEKLTPEKIEEDLPLFMDDLRWQLIKNSIIKEKELKLEESDMLEYAKKSARMQFMQYGMNNIPDEHLVNYANEMVKNEEQRRQIAEGAMGEKVMATIKDLVKLEETEISREDFNKLFEKK